MERDQLSREKQLREEAEKEKDELQEQFQGVQEAVVRPLTVLCLDTWI